jgi:hypothetical protein
MSASSLIVFLGDVTTSCLKVPLPRSVITDGVNITPTPNTTAFQCTTALEQPSLWILLAPLLALAAAVYAILATVGDYIEFKEKNLKEDRSSAKFADLEPRAMVRNSKLRMGQRLQVAAKITSATVTSAAVVAAYYYQRSLIDPNKSPADIDFLTGMFNAAILTSIATVAAACLFLWGGYRARIRVASEEDDPKHHQVVDNASASQSTHPEADPTETNSGISVDDPSVDQPTAQEVNDEKLSLEPVVAGWRRKNATRSASDSGPASRGDDSHGDQ